MELIMGILPACYQRKRTCASARFDIKESGRGGRQNARRILFFGWSFFILTGLTALQHKITIFCFVSACAGKVAILQPEVMTKERWKFFVWCCKSFICMV